MSEKKPSPIFTRPTGKACPVCGKRTYSQAGIHPQCAVDQADATRVQALKAERKRTADPAVRSDWTKKKCPKCGICASRVPESM